MTSCRGRLASETSSERDLRSGLRSWSCSQPTYRHPATSASIFCVDSSNLATWQAKTLYAALRPALGFLYRLQERMEKRGFPPGDPLFRLTANAYDALHSLCIELHCMECESGVGRKRK